MSDYIFKTGLGGGGGGLVCVGGLVHHLAEPNPEPRTKRFFVR